MNQNVISSYHFFCVCALLCYRRPNKRKCSLAIKKIKSSQARQFQRVRKKSNYLCAMTKECNRKIVEHRTKALNLSFAPTVLLEHLRTFCIFCVCVSEILSISLQRSFTFIDLDTPRRDYGLVLLARLVCSINSRTFFWFFFFTFIRPFVYMCTTAVWNRVNCDPTNRMKRCTEISCSHSANNFPPYIQYSNAVRCKI